MELIIIESSFVGRPTRHSARQTSVLCLFARLAPLNRYILLQQRTTTKPVEVVRLQLFRSQWVSWP